MRPKEDYDCAFCMSENGWTPKEIAVETGIPEETIKYWRKSWRHSLRNTYKDLYSGTDQEVKYRLIKIMQDAPQVTYNYFNSKDSNVPSATTYRKYFGSWENALEQAGIITKSDKPVRVYLVEFDGFYKIGITSQTINERLGSRYPKYTVVMEIVTTVEEAKQIEREWLVNVKQYQFIPTNFPSEGRGFTECFKFQT